MPSLNHHQFRQALGALIGHNTASPIWDHFQDDPFKSDLDAAIQTGVLCSISSEIVFIIPERIAIFTDMRKKSRSQIVQLLLDRPDDTALVVDSCLTGKDALFLAVLVQETSAINNWMSQMNPERMSLTIRPIDEQYKLMIMSLASFVFPVTSD